VGVAGLFIETHENPDQALSDGPNSWPLNRMNDLLETLISIDQVVKKKTYIEDQIEWSS
jgi:2-dehydro-3-deoxyphosphooctonate aldolase (KDO 8-P synthase)